MIRRPPRSTLFPSTTLSDLSLAVAIWPRGVPLRYDAAGRWLSVGQPCPGVSLRISQPPSFIGSRSEEHTSELQSPDQLLCPLLLEKKKTHYHAMCNSH